MRPDDDRPDLDLFPDRRNEGLTHSAGPWDGQAATLAAARSARGITAEQLAAGLGISANTLRSWERRGTGMTRAQVETVQDYLDHPSKLPPPGKPGRPKGSMTKPPASTMPKRQKAVEGLSAPARARAHDLASAARKAFYAGNHGESISLIEALEALLR